MPKRLHRREFLRTSAISGGAIAAASWRLLPGKAAWASANEKLNIAVIGVAGRGAGNLNEVASQNIVALCDVDDQRLGAAAGKFPAARTYNDFRKMLEEMDQHIDAVVVATPDHIHAPAGAMAMKMGKHCYCEKPLTHSVYEARTLARLAAKHKLATQMGTQIHAGDNYRRVVEMIQASAVGPVHEVHVWSGKGWGGGERPVETPPIPPHLHWDLWLGPAPHRPYHPTYLPANWRRWWDFGSGTLGDMACHYMDLPFWALQLRHPVSVEAEGPPVHPETCPLALIVRYEFPARGEMPPVKLTWYDGENRPPLLKEAGAPEQRSGVLFVGREGMLLADYTQRKLLPEKKFADYQPPAATIPASIGHHNEWIGACKNGGPTTCNFDYSGALSEAVLLGNAAYRAGQKLQWDAAELKAVNCPQAERFLRREYRKGWAL